MLIWIRALLSTAAEIKTLEGRAMLVGLISQSESESELLLVTRSNDNHSPGPVMREVSP